MSLSFFLSLSRSRRFVQSSALSIAVRRGGRGSFVISPFRSRSSAFQPGMPLVDAALVADLQVRDERPGIRLLEACVAGLARFACLSGTGKKNTLLNDDGSWPNAESNTIAKARLWKERATLQLNEIFAFDNISTDCSEANEWWRQLQRNLWHWLKLKLAVLEHALMHGVPAVDIAGQVVGSTY